VANIQRAIKRNNNAKNVCVKTRHDFDWNTIRTTLTPFIEYRADRSQLKSKKLLTLKDVLSFLINKSINRYFKELTSF